MAVRLGERPQAILFAAALIVAIAALYGATQALQPAVVARSEVRFVHLRVEAPEWTIRYDSTATSNNTAFSFLLEASARLGFPVRYLAYQIPQGTLVTAINGSVNGDGLRYWQYWVDGAYGVVAADHRPLHDGDTVLWRFATSQEGA